MKNNIKTLILAMLAATAPVMMTSCTEDDYYNVDINGVPEASAYVDDINITVDQETNTAYFEFTGTGVYPVWIIDGKSYQSTMSFSRYYRKAGDYQVEVKIGNGNGISNGTITKTFTIDKTQMNGFPGFVYDSGFNLWTKANRQINSFWYAPGWVQIADPACSFDGDTFTLTLPEATTDQWQAQMHVGTDISLTQGEHYDGSLIFTASMDMNKITVKIHPDGDDDDSHSFFPQQKVNLTAGEPAAFYFSDLEAAVDMNNLVYTFDFGGNPAGVEINIENIVLKKHSDDDGTVLPEIPTEQEPVWVDWASADNLFYNINYTPGFYYAPNWAQIADPGFTDNGDGSYTITLPEAAPERWQAQVSLNTDIVIDDPTVEYDFMCMVESNVDIPAVMFKLVQTDEGETKHDSNFYFADEQAIVNGTNKFWRAKVTPSEGGAMQAVSLFFDFGTCPAGTEVTISKIILQKHHD